MPKQGKTEQNEASSNTEAGPVTEPGAGGTGEQNAAEMSAGAAGSAQGPGRISPVDRSLVTAEGDMLDRRQLNDLRRKLRAKFH